MDILDSALLIFLIVVLVVGMAYFIYMVRK